MRSCIAALGRLGITILEPGASSLRCGLNAEYTVEALLAGLLDLATADTAVPWEWYLALSTFVDAPLPPSPRASCPGLTEFRN